MTVVPFLVVFFSAVIATGITGFFTIPGRPLAFGMITVAIWGVWLISVFESFHVLVPGTGKAAFFFGTFDGLYLTGTDYESMEDHYPVDNPRRGEFEQHVRRGFRFLGIRDIAYLQFPFFYDVRSVTTGVIRIPVRAAEGAFTRKKESFVVIKRVVRTLFDAETGGSSIGQPQEHTEQVGDPHQAPPALPPQEHPPRVRRDGGHFEQVVTTYRVERHIYAPVEMRIDVEILIQLGANIGLLISRLPGLTLDNPKTLGEELQARGIEPLVKEAILHAARRFTWEGPDHIIDHIGVLENEIVRHLRVSSSILVLAGFLTQLPPAQEGEQVPAPPATQINGGAAAKIDITVEEPVPVSKSLRDKMGFVAEAQYEGLATQERERGYTRAIQERGEAWQMPTENAAALSVLKDKQGSLNLVARDLVEAAALVSRMGQGGGGQGRHQGGQQQGQGRPRQGP